MNPFPMLRALRLPSAVGNDESPGVTGTQQCGPSLSNDRIHNTVTATDCTIKCQHTDNTCAQKCTDDQCRTVCKTDLDSCVASCHVTTSPAPPADGG